MTFIEALKTGRPMRRPSTYYKSPWLILGHEYNGAASNRTPRWRQIESGVLTGLQVSDYTATDWEVMP